MYITFAALCWMVYAASAGEIIKMTAERDIAGVELSSCPGCTVQDVSLAMDETHINLCCQTVRVAFSSGGNSKSIIARVESIAQRAPLNTVYTSPEAWNGLIGSADQNKKEIQVDVDSDPIDHSKNTTMPNPKNQNDTIVEMSATWQVQDSELNPCPGCVKNSDTIALSVAYQDRCCEAVVVAYMDANQPVIAKMESIWLAAPKDSMYLSRGRYEALAGKDSNRTELNVRVHFTNAPTPAPTST